jgi:hypothetical protein
VYFVVAFKKLLSQQGLNHGSRGFRGKTFLSRIRQSGFHFGFLAVLAAFRETYA